MSRRPDGVWHDPDAPRPVGATETPAMATMDPPVRRHARSRLADYLSMMKLRVSFLLVLTAVTAMFLAVGGVPPLAETVAVILGGIFMVGGAGAINHFIERDSDKLMARTADRPVASGRVSPAAALTFGLVQGVLAFALLYHYANLLSAVFGLLGLLFYVLIYTVILKRTTPQNITIGGIAGGFPVLVGWAAITGSIGIVPLLFMALIVVWTPPHFWALALVLKDDYRRANIPMMPTVKGVRRTTIEMMVYAGLTVAVSLSFFFLDVLGRVYLVSASLLGGLFLALTVDVHREADKKTARSLFGYSIVYLGLLYVAMVADIGIGL